MGTKFNFSISNPLFTSKLAIANFVSTGCALNIVSLTLQILLVTVPSMKRGFQAKRNEKTIFKEQMNSHELSSSGVTLFLPGYPD